MTESTRSHDASRRRLLIAGGASALATGFAPLLSLAEARTASPEAVGPFQLASLPYSEAALAPAISAETVALHYGKHHRGYVEKLNGLLTGDSRRGKSLEELMRATHGKSADVAIFNNAAQIWNHDFYWRSLTPSGAGSAPSDALSKAIERDFGTFGALRVQLAEAANGQFGSGWAWLVVRDGKLEVQKTGDADNPMSTGARPLLTIDVWEHAYYVDYRNRRADYVMAVIDGLLNWRIAETRLEHP